MVPSLDIVIAARRGLDVASLDLVGVESELLPLLRRVCPALRQETAC